MNDISDRTGRDPVNLLANGRTIMANERTLLAFLRTFMAFFIAGIGLIKYLDHPALEAMGCIFVVFAGVLLIWGVHRYRLGRKVLREVTPENQQSGKREMGL
ncbi:MAG: DUF202 domain-containing protein [Desulfobacterales bacterium]|jgi:putative membrane protein